MWVLGEKRVLVTGGCEEVLEVKSRDVGWIYFLLCAPVKSLAGGTPRLQTSCKQHQNASSVATKKEISGRLSMAAGRDRLSLSISRWFSL